MRRDGDPDSPYDVTISYSPENVSKNPTDYLRRHPVDEAQTHCIAEDYVNYISENPIPEAMALHKIQLETRKDVTPQKVFHTIHTGK